MKIDLIHYKRPVVIAEIGCNHKGDMRIAEQMIKNASACGADYVKFQKRNNKYLLKNDFYKPHPEPWNSYGKNYGEHREFLEFNIKQHKKLSQICKKNKIKYSVSVWEVKSAKEIVDSQISLDYLKIPSACNLDFELHEYLLKNFKKKIHISTGMTTKKEISKILNFYEKKKRLKDIVLYSCVSSYPANFKDISLLDLLELRKKYQSKINSIGFSGHHLGISVDIAALTLGAEYIERHFTLDRSWKGTDHAASLEPVGLNKLIRDLSHTFDALKFKKKNGLLNSERFQRKKLKRFAL